jgi:Protein of unknown function, DUF255
MSTVVSAHGCSTFAESHFELSDPPHIIIHGGIPHCANVLRDSRENVGSNRHMNSQPRDARRLFWSGVALVLLVRSVGCARRPAADQGPSAQAICQKMCAAIESVSSGIVRVEDATTEERGHVPVKNGFRLVFDDTGKLLRCDHDSLSAHTKYARTPAESLFQQGREPPFQAILVGSPDRDLSSSLQQPLDPHLLWFAGVRGYRFREEYVKVKHNWLCGAVVPTVSKDQAGRFVLEWAKRVDNVENVRRLIVNPALGFVPVRNEIATRLVGVTGLAVTEWSEIRYEKKHGCFVPVSLDIHWNGGPTTKVTCHWESVNEHVDPKVFTVAGFEPTTGTTVYDLRGPEPELLAVTSTDEDIDRSTARAMSADKPLDVRLQNALAASRLLSTSVLVFIASPKSGPCRRFFSIRQWRDPQDGDDEARKALGNLIRLPIDASAGDRGAELRTLLARWSLAPPAPDDAVLAVIDSDGHLVADTTSKQLSPGKPLDARPLAAFLHAHRPTVPDAQTRLANALAQAKSENKRVLVEQSGVGCGWCHVLARYFDRHRALIERDYVWIVIDRRFTHGETIVNKLRPDAEGGIPWMVILDADGKRLITSDGPKGNIGYPGDAKDLPQFEKMLRTTARHLSDSDIKTLLADVRAK